jgi:hypothetical protein
LGTGIRVANGLVYRRSLASEDFKHRVRDNFVRSENKGLEYTYVVLRLRRLGIVIIMRSIGTSLTEYNIGISGPYMNAELAKSACMQATDESAGYSLFPKSTYFYNVAIDE